MGLTGYEALFIPRWGTTGLLVLLVILFILSWIQARQTANSLRSRVLINALLAGGVSLIFAREFFGELPLWIDVTLPILVSIIMLVALGSGLVQLKRYLKSASWLEWTRHK
jgi:CDP-diglyceride synthetase